MIDLLDILLEANKAKRMASINEIHIFLDMISKSNILTYDWEEGDEAWISVFAKNKSIAKICTKVPIVFVSKCYEKFLLPYSFISSLYVVAIDDFDKNCWTMNLDLYKNNFPQLQWCTDTINLNSFSTNDFWYATILG